MWRPAQRINRTSLRSKKSCCRTPRWAKSAFCTAMADPSDPTQCGPSSWDPMGDYVRVAPGHGQWSCCARASTSVGRSIYTSAVLMSLNSRHSSWALRYRERETQIEVSRTVMYVGSFNLGRPRLSKSYGAILYSLARTYILLCSLRCSERWRRPLAP